MALFRKDKIPELPLSPSLPDLPKSKKNDLPELPSFPNNEKNTSMNEDMVKSAISDNYIPEEDEVTEESGEINFPPVSSARLPGRASIMSEPEESSSLEVKIPKSPIPSPPVKPAPIKVKTQPAEVPAVRTHSIPRGGAAISDSVEPIFIRIDKFQLAKKNLEQIKEKVEEMEQIIGKIRTIKEKEEEDIKSWSDEVARLKMSISEIDSNVFSQI
jgi:hypothetical protein